MPTLVPAVDPFNYVLRWPLTGTIICRCCDPNGDPDVSQIEQHLEAGCFADCGAPAVKRNELDTGPIEEYVLFYDGKELTTFWRFSHVPIPDGAYIDVVRRPCDEYAFSDF